MGFMKDLWIAEHERLTNDYMDRHPRASWDEAYNKTSDHVDNSLRDRLADMADLERMKKKEGNV